MKTLFLILSLLALFSVSYADNYGTILQLTDIHYDQLYEKGAPATCWFAEKVGLRCCRKYDISIAPHRKAEEYGDFDCDTPYSLVELTFEWLSKNNVSEYPLDFVFWTGDTAGHHDITQSFDFNMEAVAKVTALMEKHLPDTRVIPAIGNHDTWPIDQLAPPNPNSTKVTETLNQLWSNWLSPRMIHTFYYGGYYTTKILDNLRLVVVNCLYEDKNNLLDKFSKDPAYQYKWLNQTLFDAEKVGEEVWIVGHIFPSAGEGTSKFTSFMEDLTNRYSSTIKYQFFGHSHDDEFRVYLDKNQDPSGFLFVSPSLMPDKHHPQFRAYVYDRETYEIVDYYQFYANLTKINDGTDMNYHLLYKAKESYGLENMDAESWFNLVDRMKSNSTLLDMYNTWFSYRYPLKQCTGTCPNSTIKSLLLS